MGDSFDLERGCPVCCVKKIINKKEYDNILRTIDLIKADQVESEVTNG